MSTLETLEILKTLILDFQELDFPASVPRRLPLQSVPGKAAVCIGVRRGGKSTRLFQVIQRLQDRGISRQNILYLNFFDDRLHGLQSGHLGSIAEAYYSLYPEKKNAEKVYCFFDEIQTVTGWEAFVDRLMRTEKCEIYLTGSSSRMLSREIATQMRGRSLSWELFPFSFREFLDAGGITGDLPLSTKKRLLVRKAFEEYWETGGFPEVMKLDRHLRVKTHQEYFQTILFRDLVERHDISHPKAISDLAHWLANNTASLYSVNRLTGYLKSLGQKVPKASVSEYLEWFEDAYFLFSVRLFDPSQSRSQANPKKIYCIDHALVVSVSSGILVNSGHLLENLVFVSLRRLYPAIYYYRTKNGREVDFIVPGFKAASRIRSGVRSQKALFQVCDSLVNPQTRKREVSALEEAMEELKFKTAIIVTRNEEAQIESRGKVISVLPAWRFLLELPEAIE